MLQGTESVPCHICNPGLTQVGPREVQVEQESRSSPGPSPQGQATVMAEAPWCPQKPLLFPATLSLSPLPATGGCTWGWDRKEELLPG